MSKKNGTFKIGRDSKTGQFVSIKETHKNPTRYKAEHMPKSGYGDKLKPRPPRKSNG